MPKTMTQIRLDDDVYTKIRTIAEEECRSINGQMEYFIRTGIAKWMAERGVSIGADGKLIPEL